MTNKIQTNFFNAESAERKTKENSVSSATSAINTSLAYKKAGVDISQTTKIKSNIKSLVKKTFSPNVLSDIGLFGGLFELNLATEPQRTQRTSLMNKKFTASESRRAQRKNKISVSSVSQWQKSKNPVLVSSCDGVGTKVLIAKMMNKHNTVGEDLVNHCINDILTLGAKPLFFLDYIAYSDIDSKVIEQVISGLANGCKKNNCALIGGETAMMPGMYKKGEYDLVGFIVGMVNKDKIIDGKKIKAGDKLIGIPSSGLHTNGYSLARKVFFSDKKFTVNTKLPELKQSLGEALLKTHCSYLKQVYPLLPYVSAIAHITGGAFYKNIIRLLPKNLSCLIYKDRWKVPNIFKAIQKYGKISEAEMYSVFNMGIGMILFMRPQNVNKIKSRIPQAKVIGEVVKGNFGINIV
ncbi:phosphoribosylformylglycinamidine cyclo-ligase [Dolichospermum sp. ST_sed9]|nr:phosphoribosylformylglycinamidine cyclo-ligase [Dolichospermum sp. ST_sed9]